MLFEKQLPLNLLTCATCQSTGFVGLRRCPECRGMAMGHAPRERWLFWGYPLTRYHLQLHRVRLIVNKVRLITVFVLGLNMWGWMLWYAAREHLLTNLLSLEQWPLFFIGLRGGAAFLFWSGVLCWLYLWYRLIAEGKRKTLIERYKYDFESGNKRLTKEGGWTNWPEARKLARRGHLNITNTYTDEALAVLGSAYSLADKHGHSSVEPAHLFWALLSSNRVANIFIRLAVPAHAIQKQIETILNSLPARSVGNKDLFTMPLISVDVQQILFQAYEEAYLAHQDYVSVTELLLSTIKQSEKLQEILYDLNITRQKLINVAEWARIRERLYRQYVKYRGRSRRRSKKGMDRAMTAVQTPFLNRFSDDLTLLAQLGYLENCVAREREIEEIFRVVAGGGQNVLLVGDNGAGKRSIIEGLAQKMAADDVPLRLRDKRLVRLSVSSLLAGTTPAGAVERLQGIMHEIARAGNIILFIHNIHELAGVSTGSEGGSLDVADTLAESLGRGHFLTLATTTTEEFAQHIASSPLSNIFSKVEIKEMDENQAIQVLEAKVGAVEYKQKVFFSYDAIAKAVQLARRFLHDVCLPGSALEVMLESAVQTHNRKGSDTLVTSEEVATVVAAKTHIPLNTVGSDESSKLLHLEEEMHRMVIGQDEAVELVANALRRARAEIRSVSRPIANFMFLGPTGVGKTELAKTIARVYFGGEERMIRLDMSEYQDKTAIYRLIGAPGEKGTGVLTEAVRRQPFALLLLDEIEKADKDIINLFLQVMDDGRLTDSSGRVVDCTNLILIATSNAGTSFVQEQIRVGISSEAIKEKLLHGELKQYFRPEFLNRFDGIVLFKSLSRADIKQVAGLMLKRVAKDLEAKGMELKIEDAALEFLADVGFDPEFGARPMRRAIQERIENKLAELVLSKKLRRRDTIILGQDGEMSVQSA